MSARANGPGVPGGGGAGTFSSRITILIGKLMKGTLDASAQTAHANLPPGLELDVCGSEHYLDLA